METLIIILAISAGIIGIAGSILPGLPGTPVSWLGLLILYIWGNGTKLSECSQGLMHELTIADIDVEKLDSLRRRSTTFTSFTPDGIPSSSYNPLYCQTYLGEACATDFHKMLYRAVEKHPFAPESDLDSRCRKIIDLQVKALSGRLNRIQSKAVIGISGGLDSTLALIVTALAFDSLKATVGSAWERNNITAVTMPGFGTTSRTKNNAWDLMKALGVTCREISIVPACEQHFKDIGHDISVHDATYENTQARERTQILMDIANQTGGIVVGTGDLSELALGWATYNGDHMSMYSVNATIPKTLVRQIVHWVARNESNKEISKTLIDIIETPVSPELVPTDDKGNIAQKTEDLVGPYELHDFFIYHFTRYGYSPEKIFAMAERTFAGSYSKETIKKWLTTFFRRFFTQQFKRSCMPDGPDTGFCSLNPTTGWKMTSDTSHSIWSQACEKNI